jgi:L-rhamnose mutarotase
MKLQHLIIVSICALGLSACTSSTPPAGSAGSVRVQRYGMITGLKPEKEAYYRDLHAHPWPAVNKMIRDCNIRNYSIYVKEIDGKKYLFSYFEYVGNDFDADMKKMAADSETVRWWKETDPCQAPLPDAAAKAKIWSTAEEVYHLD